MGRPKRSELTPKQHKAALLLSTGASNRVVAEEVGVSESTVAGWWRRDYFRDELKRAMEHMRMIFESRMMSLANDSSVTIQQMQRSNDPFLQLAAARISIGAAVRLNTRYKEMHHEGYTPPQLFVLPPGTHISTERTTPEPPRDMPRLIEGRVVDVEARAVPEPIEIDDEDPDSN